MERNIPVHYIGGIFLIAQLVLRRATISTEGVRFPAGTKKIPTQEPIQHLIHWIPETVSLLQKWPEREADHSCPSSAEVENGGNISPLSHTSSWRGV
jgi:hypothetical protein